MKCLVWHFLAPNFQKALEAITLEFNTHLPYVVWNLVVKLYKEQTTNIKLLHENKFSVQTMSQGDGNADRMPSLKIRNFFCYKSWFSWIVPPNFFYSINVPLTWHSESPAMDDDEAEDDYSAIYFYMTAIFARSQKREKINLRHQNIWATNRNEQLRRPLLPERYDQTAKSI